MTITLYRKAINLLLDADIDLITVDKVDIKTLDELAKNLNVILPESYKLMLIEFGILGFEGDLIAGIGKDGIIGSTFSNVHFATMKSREIGEISEHMIWIMDTGYGPDFVIDCTQLDPIGEAPVYEINELGYKHGMKKVADSFGEFLLNEVKMAVENL